MKGKKSKLVKSLHNNRVKIATTLTCLVLCAAILFTTVSAGNTVKIIYNGDEYQVRTLRTDAESIINQSGIDFDRAESYIDTSKLDKHGIITIETVCGVMIIDEDKKTQVNVHGTIEDALNKANITLNKNDEIEGYKTTDYIKPGMVINIKRAVSVMISADGDITTVYVPKGSTIADALNKAVITADDDDIVSKPLDTVITSNTAVKITKIETVERQETQIIKYKTVEQNDNTLAKGKTKIKQTGENGEQIAIYEDKFVNGELVESNLKSTTITKPAVNCVKLVGTKAAAVSASASVSHSKPASGNKTNSSGGNKGVKYASSVKTISTFTPPASLKLTSSGAPATYKKKLVGRATAYHCGTTTATGAAVRPGVVAVDPREIPYHSKMWIVSNDKKYVYGYCSAEDTGGFIYSTDVLVDLYMPTLNSCYDFGSRQVTVYVL